MRRWALTLRAARRSRPTAHRPRGHRGLPQARQGDQGRAVGGGPAPGRTARPQPGPPGASALPRRGDWRVSGLLPVRERGSSGARLVRGGSLRSRRDTGVLRPRRRQGRGRRAVRADREAHRQLRGGRADAGCARPRCTPGGASRPDSSASSARQLQDDRELLYKLSRHRPGHRAGYRRTTGRTWPARSSASSSTCSRGRPGSTRPLAPAPVGGGASARAGVRADRAEARGRIGARRLPAGRQVAADGLCPGTSCARCRRRRTTRSTRSAPSSASARPCSRTSTGLAGLRNRATHAETNAPPAADLAQLRELAHDAVRHLGGRYL